MDTIAAPGDQARIRSKSREQYANSTFPMENLVVPSCGDSSSDACPSTVEKIPSTSKQVEPEHEPGLLALEDTSSTCFICMAKFTKKHPPTPIPCENKCNNSPVHAKCIYEWKERNSVPGSCPLCRGELGIVNYKPPDYLHLATFFMFSARRNFIVHPIPKGAGVVRCFLIMEPSTKFPYFPTFKMYIQKASRVRYPGGDLPDEHSPHSGDQLLLVAKKRATKLGRTVIEMSMDENNFTRKSVYYMGRVRSNFSGLEHSVTAPLRGTSSSGGTLAQIAAIQYTQNRVGHAIGPRKMRVCIPINVEESQPNLGFSTDKSSKATTAICPVSEVVADEQYEELDSDGEIDEGDKYNQMVTSIHHPTNKSDSLLHVLKKGQEAVERHGKMSFARNTEPYWLDAIQAYSLDFQGRVSLPSNKNFQLVVDPDNDKSNSVSLQFGKVYEKRTEVYTLDVQYPLSPLQAFGIVLTACDRKLACA